MMRRWRASGSSSGRTVARPGTQRYRRPTRTRGSRWVLRTYPARNPSAERPTRAEEAQIQVAFAARAATSPALAEIQRAVLTEINDALTQTLVQAASGNATAERCRLVAQVAVATADGLALHAVSSPGWISASQLTAALELLLDALIPESPQVTADVSTPVE